MDTASTTNRKLRFVLAFFAALGASAPRLSHACETCAVFSATSLREVRAGRWSAAVTEQYTDYKLSGGDLSTEALRDGERLKSYSVTQLNVSHDFSDSIGAQLSLPVIARSFHTFEAFRRSNEAETGFGDASILARYSPYSKRTAASAIHTTIFAGLKLPTGDSGSLRDGINAESGDGSAGEPEGSGPKHHQGGGIPGLPGRVLTLGSGSWDTFSGLGALLRWKRALVIVTGEYTIRTEGDYDYRFANDTVWSAGPGYYLWLEDDMTVALHGLLSGEHKGRDVHDGVKVDGTAAENFYAGPSVLVTGGERIFGELSFQVPFSTDNPKAIVEPEFRIRAALNYLF